MWPLVARQIQSVVLSLELPFLDPLEDPNVWGVTVDSRNVKPGDLFVAIAGDRFDGHKFLHQAFEAGALYALVAKKNPYVLALEENLKKRCFLVDDVFDSLRKLAKFFRDSFPFPVIAIGGSNGKTTTKEMLWHMLSRQGKSVSKTQKSENGFLGIPLTLLSREHNQNQPPAALVLEIGIDTVGAMAQHVTLALPDVALLTALGPEHLEGLKNWDTAVQEELELFRLKKIRRIWQCGDPKIAEAGLSFEYSAFDQDFYLCAKDQIPEILKHKKNLVTWQLTCSQPQESLVVIYSPCGEKSFRVPLPGHHNSSNFALAVATALSLGLSLEEIEQGFQTFVPPPMRSHITQHEGGVTLFNDAYNSSPWSLFAALKTFDHPKWCPKKKIFILADMLDLGKESSFWHEKLAEKLQEFSNTTVCLYGHAMLFCFQLLSQDTIKRRLTNQGSLVLWMDPSQSPSSFFESLVSQISGSLVLVKGSRGMHLERFVEDFEKQFPAL